ncbi:MAG TPA: hypothetical protein VMH04_07025 [Candidatus Solibacter sp.]|nr:hypothetical protein [Candidatus Solibacter sp.]
MKKNLVLTLAAALLIITVGCGDSKSPTLTYVARSSSDNYIPHPFMLNESTQQTTAISIPLPDSAEYVSFNSDATAATYCRDGDSGWDIFLMGTDGVEKELTTGADACESVFSPDGKTIAFVSYQSDLQVFTMNADGSNQAPLLTLDPGWEQYYPEFSPNGKSIAFYVYSNSAKSAARLHGSLGTSLWATQKPVRTSQSRRASVAPVSVSADGIYMMSIGDTAPTLVYSPDSLWGPAVFTGDGKGVLFTQYDGTEDNIFSVSLDGSNLTPLTTSTDTYNISAVPYKNLIVFNRPHDDSGWDIYVMNQDGSNQVLVHSTEGVFESLQDSNCCGD